ncbi:MAG: hypothetical protein KGN33_04840 [Paracoccaceae bacterium]|nr:hypothetical protein [Paracoccaceae bacterium]
MLTKRIYTFLRQDGGAVTVDWVVLTALVVVLAGTAVSEIGRPVTQVGQGIAAAMTKNP